MSTSTLPSESTPSKTPDGVDVVLVNWNSGGDLQNCLRVLASVPDVVLVRSVIVVDNGSTDGSADELPDRLAEAAVVTVRNGENRGFAAACNQGAVLGQAPFVLFLNTDVEVEPNSLATPAAYLRDPTHARVGVCGIQLVDRQGHVQPSCARFPQPLDVAGQLVGLDRLGVVRPHFVREWDHADTREVEQVIGAFFFVRRAVFEALDGFDERFFVFYEELEFSLRARRAGWASVYLASARAFHSGEAASRPSAVRQFYADRSRVLYAHKHFRRAPAVAVAVLTLVASPVARAAYLVSQRNWAGLREAARAAGLLWRAAPALLTGGDSRAPVR